HKVWCTDGVTDHFYFSGETSSYIRSIQISDFYSEHRTRTRSDITLTGGVERLHASNVICDRFEIELNESYDGNVPMVANLNNIYCRQQLDLEGETEGPIIVHGTNLVAMASFTLTGLRGSISNSMFYTAAGEQNRINFINNFTFENCRWIL